MVRDSKVMLICFVSEFIGSTESPPDSRFGCEFFLKSFVCFLCFLLLALELLFFVVVVAVISSTMASKAAEIKSREWVYHIGPIGQ